MKKLILIILLTILLSGCGLYNLNWFTLPDDTEFLTVIESLDTPKKISDYMQGNFTYELHPFKAVDPYNLWITGKGDCNDFSTFGTFMANYHGYKTYQIKMYLQNTLYIHFLGVYVEGNYSFTSNQYYYCDFNTFREIVEENCKHIAYECKSYKVYDYENNLIEVGNFN